MRQRITFLLIVFSSLVYSCQNEPTTTPFVEAAKSNYLQISGIYPHLTAYNQPEAAADRDAHLECGIGAVVPWAGKLWYITYPPHQRTGSNDKLYMVDENLNLTIRPESVGGTHANRMIHKESNQLIIGPYFIDAEGKVRSADVNQLEGRLTATTRHLTDPENMVYFVDMEGTIYEVNVHTLAVTKLFDKPVPGWHGKGAYVGQGRLIVANNGEHEAGQRSYQSLLVGGEAQNRDEAGVLAEWNGNDWSIIERKQFTDVTGPGGISGNEKPSDPVWSMGWDKRSVLLKVLDNGQWHTYRLPKGSHTFDPRHGWFTEWPRIRAVSDERMMMVMHGTLFEFPKSFSAKNTGGIRPIATHLRYIPDFTYWNGELILAADDASRLQNPTVGQPQSNLWFGKLEDLNTFGPALGWGGVYMNDAVKGRTYSDPFLVKGYDKRILHLSHQDDNFLQIILEKDVDGTGNWVPHDSLLAIPKTGYIQYDLSHIDATWLRLKPLRDATLSAYFHCYSTRQTTADEATIFQGLAAAENENATVGIIRPAGHNRSLQFVEMINEGTTKYWEIELDSAATDLVFSQTQADSTAEVLRYANFAAAPFAVDDASVVITDEDGQVFRLPKGNTALSKPWMNGTYPRALREVQSERYLANIHGSFYEVPRREGAGNHVPDWQKMKPVSTHNRRISDYCSWRGLLVLTGVQQDAAEDGQVFTNGNGTGLWFGNVDNLWKFGKPVGIGGPWKNTAVQANTPSDPYLMTGFDKKRLELSHDLDSTVEFTIEIAFSHTDDWQAYQTLTVAPQETRTFDFPPAFQAHWVRLKADKTGKATATLYYE